MTSGVATMSKEIVLGTLQYFDWVQVGAALNHPENGKIVILDEDIRSSYGIPDAKLKIIPFNGYGNIHLLRNLISEEKPDAILHFTDPHYWEWMYAHEHEIRQTVPLLFYHIWDDLPDPQYNRDYYESCDWVGCISKQTYGIVRRVSQRDDSHTFNPLKNHQIMYVPHGINPNVFKPVDNIDREFKKSILGDKEYDFILFFNNRNIRRKHPADVIYTFKLFCDELPKEKSSRCLLLMHTAEVDENGTDLGAVKNDLCPDYNVIFTKVKLPQEKLNQVYNMVDCTINISNNEGFGLATAESIMAGTPIIVNVTGGLQDQCGFQLDDDEFSEYDYVKIGSLHDRNKWGNLKHGDWVIPIWPSSILLNGSVRTPYIFEDRVSHLDVKNALLKMYYYGNNKRKEYGIKGREWALNKLSSTIMCEKFIEGINSSIDNFVPREKFELYKMS